MMNGGPISWKSRRQDNVSLSTSEAEFVAASQAGLEAIYLRETLNDSGFSQTQAYVGLPIIYLLKIPLLCMGESDKAPTNKICRRAPLA